MPELRINADKVCQFIDAARQVASKVVATTGDKTTTGDDSPRTFMEDYGGGDPVRQQMVDFVAGLNVEEQVDLLGLIYLGRGDFDIADWHSALDEARDRIAAGDADFMIGDRALPAHLSEALDAFGKSCPD